MCYILEARCSFGLFFYAIFIVKDMMRETLDISGYNLDIVRILAEVEYMRTKITLACTECKQRNYNTTKEKKNHPERMEIKKYCRFCRTHTLHKETK